MSVINAMHAAFAELEEQAPTEVGAAHTASLESGTGERRHFGIAMLVSAATVAAVVTGVVVASNTSTQHNDAAPAPATPASSAASSVIDAGAPGGASGGGTADPTMPLTSNVFTLGALPNDYRVFENNLTNGDQTVGLATATDHSGPFIDVRGASQWVPAVPADATAVTVNGQNGYFSNHFDLSGDTLTGGINRPVTGILWHDPSGRSVLVGAWIEPATQAQLLAIANAVHVGSTQPFTSPLKFGYLPAGLHLSASSHLYTFGPTYGTGTPDVRYTFSDAADRDVIDVEITPKSTAAQPGAQVLTVNGFSGGYGTGFDSFSNGKLTISLMNDLDPHKAIAQDEVTKILQGLTVSPTPTSPAGWFDLAKSLP